KLSYKEQRELDALPERIAALEAEQKTIGGQLEDGSLYASDPPRAAQLAGFTALSSSDHFHPWSERQGESGHSWSWLGAAMATVDLPTGVVACPFG
ncbi:hypothetical protein NK280_23815, partial [Salmonella enterica]|nr:hypothetical protein [Salmonella enterica]